MLRGVAKAANGGTHHIKGNTVLSSTWLEILMIGIYKITNTQNQECYIGQSKDLNRRKNDHLKYRNTSNRLFKDIEKYGVDNFKFEVLEECEEADLLSRETYYIKKYNPYYNIVGKDDKEFNSLVSRGTKEWWNSLPEETKNRIITENLKGPKKGHEVSKETRAKISKKVSEVQKQPIRIIETGQLFESVRALEEYLGACTGTVASYLKGKIKTVKGYHVEKV